ncbi:MAG: DMT family transporter [Verrucomicrobiales bacterium]
MPTLLQLHLLVVLLTSTTLICVVISSSASVIVCWRTALASLGAFLWVRLSGKRKLWPGGREALTLIAVGSIIGFHWVALFGAVKLSNVSISLAGLATISLFTAFTEPLILRRRFRPFEALLGLLVVAGIVLIAGVEKGNLLGLSTALISALLAAIFPVINQKLVHRGGDPMVMVGWEMAGACLASLIVLPLFDPIGYRALTTPPPSDFFWFLVLALACTVYGQAAHIKLLRKISAYAGNLAFNFEPVYGILAAAFIFQEHESLHPAFYLGALAIVAANVLHPWLERRLKTHTRPASAPSPTR